MPEQDSPVRNGAARNGDSQASVAELRQQVEQLYKAIESRDVIGQAKGILMEREKLTADEAFDRLRIESQHTNRKVVELARELAETGEWPVGGV